MSKIRFLPICLLLLVPCILAQDDPFTLKVDVQVVSVDVVVSDARGALVNGLSKSDFEIYEDGIKQDIRFFSPVSAPYNVFLLFDRSSSTRADREFMQKAVMSFIEKLRPQDRVAVASFAKGYDVDLAWTGDRLKVKLAIEQTSKHQDVSETRLYAALDRTLGRQFKNVVGRRAVIALTDGQDTDYSHDYDQDFLKALKAATVERIPLYFLALGSADVSAVQQRYRERLVDLRDNMQLLADRSGGEVHFPKTVAELIPMYEQIGQVLGASYSLGYIPITRTRKGTNHRIVVKARSGSLNVAQSRKGYTSQ